MDKESLESLVKLAAAARLPNGIPPTPSNDMNQVSVSRNCLPSVETIVTHPAAHHSCAQ